MKLSNEMQDGSFHLFLFKLFTLGRMTKNVGDSYVNIHVKDRVTDIDRKVDKKNESTYFFQNIHMHLYCTPVPTYITCLLGFVKISLQKHS